jgi:hypothetical protein
MSLSRNFIDQSEQDKQAVNYLLEDGQTIDILRAQTATATNAGFDSELTEHAIIATVLGRIDPKGDKFIGLTDYMDCQKNDIWRKLNVRDEHKYWRVVSVKPRIGGCQVELEEYTKWQR